eukprot:1302_1
MCKMNVKYEYDDNNILFETFGTKEAKQILFNGANYLLQYIDQKLLDKTQNGVQISISLEIKYQHMSNGDKCSVRIWRHNSSYFKVLEIGNNFNWKLTENTTINHEPICVSSLWITNKSNLNCIGSNNTDLFRILCKQKLTINDYSTLSMNQSDGKICILCVELYLSPNSNIIVTCDDNIDDKMKEESDPSILIITNYYNIKHDDDDRIDGTVLFGFVSKHENIATNPKHDHACKHACNRYYGNGCCEYACTCSYDTCCACSGLCHSYGCFICECICYPDCIKCKKFKTNRKYIKWYRQWNRLDVEIPVKYNMIDEIIKHQFNIKNVGNRIRNPEKCQDWWFIAGWSILCFIMFLWVVWCLIDPMWMSSGAAIVVYVWFVLSLLFFFVCLFLFYRTKA